MKLDCDMDENDIPLAVMIQRFAEIYTGAITDVLDALGLYHQTLPSTLKPIKFGICTVGAAFPIRGKPKRQLNYDESIRPILKMLGQVPENSVAVYETNDNSAAHLGELSVTAIKRCGCRGAVIDGGVRDVEYILREDFPVWSRYTTPADAVPRWQIVEWNCVVTIGDVQVGPGDIIVADYDGIVAVPQSMAGRVLTKCEELVSTENKVREAVNKGAPPLEAYEKFGEF